MAVRSIRHALLVLAAWAVLFAPGTAAGQTDEQAPIGADDVALAMIAPTFGTDGIVAARTCRTTDTFPTGCPTSAGDVVLPPALSGSHVVVAIGRHDVPAARGDEARRSAPTRAPPSN